MGSALVVLCGVALWQMPLGERWVTTSYDYLFRFGAKSVTNKVVLVLMDNAAHSELQQERGRPWERALHAKLLNQLAADGCPLVVFDVHFESQRQAEADAALAEAMRRQSNIVLMADVDNPQAPKVIIDRIKPPHEYFLNAATKWGIAKAGVELLETPRRHWPFPSPADFPTLSWAAAQAAGAKLSATPEKRWLRYYGNDGPWETWSYHLVPTNAGYFRDKIVFIGSEPEKKHDPHFQEEDKFHTPYTRWTGIAVGGVEIMATTFLNLMNGDWLRRLPWPVEMLFLITSGLALGGLGCVRPMVALGIGGGAALALTIGAVTLSQFTNYWFPWLVVVGGQVPCALAWSIFSARTGRSAELPARELGPTGTVIITEIPETPDYELFQPPFGQGGFGKVWLARNAIGQWQALKAVYQSKFGSATGPYEAEFKGIERYKPVSEKHPGLLRIDFVSRMKPEGYFYYVMELGDGQTADWQKDPATYKPWDLTHLRARSAGGRVPVMDCLRAGLVLSEALDFLHGQGLTHRDIKPSNVIFVNGRPKLADVGLVSQIRSPDQIQTYAGTPGYMPPPPEPPGTVVADIYALGMLLYVTSTGSEPTLFPNLSTTLMERTGHAEFIRLNAIILKACQPDPRRRYTSAAEMHAALEEALQAMTNDTTATT
jgi:CHASE2 domain-containing sensor protein